MGVLSVVSESRIRSSSRVCHALVTQELLPFVESAVYRACAYKRSLSCAKPCIKMHMASLLFNLFPQRASLYRAVHTIFFLDTTGCDLHLVAACAAQYTFCEAECGPSRAASRCAIRHHPVLKFSRSD